MDNNTLALIAAVLGGGGLGGTIIALFKVKPEANRIVIDAAQGAVVVQSGVIDSLNVEIARVFADVKRVREEHRDCEDRLKKLEKAFKAIDERQRE